MELLDWSLLWGLTRAGWYGKESHKTISFLSVWNINRAVNGLTISVKLRGSFSYQDIQPRTQTQMENWNLWSVPNKYNLDINPILKKWYIYIFFNIDSDCLYKFKNLSNAGKGEHSDSLGPLVLQGTSEQLCL